MTLTPIRFLLLMVLALCAELLSLWMDQQGQWLNITWVTPAAKAPALQVPTSLLSGTNLVAPSYVSIQERPLFAPDRRPPPPPPPPAPPDPFASIQIHGIFSGINAGILARIDDKVRRVKINETVGAWTLKSIEGRNIIFTQGDQTRQLPLVYARLNTVTPPSASTTTKPATPRSPMQSAVQDPKSAYREELRRRNELNAARGLPIQLE